MKLKNLALAVGAAAAFCVSGAQAASFAPDQTFVVNTAITHTVFTPFASKIPDTTPWYYELVNGTLNNLLTKVELIDTLPDLAQVNYRVFVDADNTVGLVDTAGGPFLMGSLIDTNLLTANPFFQFLMNTGTQYILELTKVAGSPTLASETTISAVPLPGAIWLFGSALLGFLGFSNRRKV